MIYTRMQTVIVVLVIPFLTLFNIYPLQAKESPYSMPDTINQNSNYLFFFHNYYVEMNGTDGDCKFIDLLRNFTDKGFVVVSQLRNPDMPLTSYANEAAEQIQAILNAGVPPANITVSGHSKGGVIALNVAALLQQPDIKYVILAGCGITPLAHMYPDPLQIKGTFLSLYANSDKIAASCSAILSPVFQGVTTMELILDSPEGHRLFFEPNIIWLTHIESVL